MSDCLNGGPYIHCHGFLKFYCILRKDSSIRLFLVYVYIIYFIVAREELIKLQRDYRKSEGLRKSITESSQNDIRKQKYILNLIFTHYWSLLYCVIYCNLTPGQWLLCWREKMKSWGRILVWLVVNRTNVGIRWSLRNSRNSWPLMVG